MAGGCRIKIRYVQRATRSLPSRAQLSKLQWQGTPHEQDSLAEGRSTVTGQRLKNPNASVSEATVRCQRSRPLSSFLRHLRLPAIELEPTEGGTSAAEPRASGGGPASAARLLDKARLARRIIPAKGCAYGRNLRQ
jgi:hypothetical protein